MNSEPLESPRNKTHNAKVVGSNPTPVTNPEAREAPEVLILLGFFCFY
jgi:hypothetical protein